MICEQHGIEHTQRFPCAEYERYSQLSTQAHSVTEHEAHLREDVDGNPLCVEQVEKRTLTAGWQPRHDSEGT